MGASVLHSSAEFKFLQGGGEMGERTRGYDWSHTPVGPVQQWPQALRTTVGILLHTDFPMFLWWGDDLIQFYNDAYRSSLGNDGKHPHALGQRAVECWPEIWHIIWPLIEQVKSSGKSFFAEDQLIPIFRNGAIEDVYWTFSYSAVIGDTGEIDGVLVVCTETTKKVHTLLEVERTRRELQASEENFRNIIQQAPVAMCVFEGANHIIKVANEKMFTLWGRSAEEVLGKPHFEAMPDTQGQGFEGLLGHVYATGETFSTFGMPVRLLRNGHLEVRHVQFVLEGLRGSDGAIIGIMALAIDVSEQVRGQEAVKESEHRIRSVIENAPFPIALYSGREMRIEFANQAVIEVWGKGPDVIGKTYYELLPELESQEVYPNLDNVFTTGKPFHARNQLVKLVMNGTLKNFYFNYSFTPLFNTAGEVTGVMNTAADVTDLVMAKKKVEISEQNFRNMILQAPVAMCIMLGPEHVVEIANELMIALWGKNAESVMHKPIFEGLPEAREQGLEQLLAHVYHTGETFRATERPVELLRNGRREVVYQDFVYEPYRDPGGNIIGVLAATIDVTDKVVARQQIEAQVNLRTRELAVANAELKKSNAELTQYAYITSHDLQEPARKINTFVEMLTRNLSDTLDERSRTYLQKIDTASSRMLALIRDVLALSQLAKSDQLFTRVDLSAVLAEVYNDFELMIEQKNCEVRMDVLPVIEAIPVQMSQLMSNLFSNALKFTTGHTPLRLHIRLEEPSANDKLRFSMKEGTAYCKINFIDNGIGFDQANAVQIFEIFQRLHAKSEYQGTGIGLAMCKKIVENHNGYIYATASPNAGATFSVILPFAQPTN